MTTTVTELFKSRETDTAIAGEPGESSGTLIVMVKGTSDEATARAAALTSTAAVWDGKFRQRVKLERIGPQKFLARVEYTDEFEPLETGEWRISFDTTGGSVRQTLALAERRYPDAGTPDQHNAINVIDGKPQGIDWPIGTIKITVHFRAPAALITVNYIRAMAALVGCVNSHAFLGFDAKELLFLGATGGQSSVDSNIDYHFLCGENLASFDIGDITGIQKDAHEYLWTLFRDGVDEETLVTVPEAVIVNSVAREANFWTLEIEDEPEE